ncbi:hypothetical protein C8F01DRAFT_1090459 [Mycena amicta]|nr:hypothetical protein C8F01DRAFT_1090459 [Mycena amicta]
MAIYEALADHPLLADIPFADITTLMHLLGALQNDIILAQPKRVDTTDTPLILSPTIIDFLVDSTSLSPDAILAAWSLLGDEIWNTAMPTLSREEKCLFERHGSKRGLTWLTLFPPSQRCMNLDCIEHGRSIKRDEARQVIVYTVADGAVPAWSIHLTCGTCKTNFHHNFAVNAGMRTYYSEISQFVQIGEHQFADVKLISLWITLMLTSWVSGTNCARSYDMALAGSQETLFDTAGWQFGWSLTTDHVWDAFVILTLLQYHNRYHTQLHVPHTGLQKDRFTEAMRPRNREVVKLGQDEVAHCCNHCMRQYKNPTTGIESDIQVVVADGLSMGHPCCSEKHCMKELESNRDQFCPEHQYRASECAVVDCRAPIIPGKKTCSEPKHMEMQVLHEMRGQAAFTLTNRLQKHRLAHPDPGEAGEEEGVPAADNEEWFELNAKKLVVLAHAPTKGSIGVDDSELNGADVPCESSKDPAGNRKYKAKFSRSRTHNKFILSRPCGIIAGRGTFQYAEATSNALWCTQQVFSVPGAHKPEHFVYDTNCDAKQQVNAHIETTWKWWKDVKMTVDVFHFLHKHSVDHDFCQKHCNPADFPELMIDGKWFFNTSVAEQNNVWLGGYHSMCHEMAAVKYNFFLDEMIRLRNMQVVAKLADTGANPRTRL